MNSLNRRNFLAGAVAGAAGLSGPAHAAHAIEPIRREGRSLIRLSLAAYSFRQALNLRRKPPTMTLDGFIDLAASLPFDAVELTEYYFPETGAALSRRAQGPLHAARPRHQRHGDPHRFLRQQRDAPERADRPLQTLGRAHQPARRQDHPHLRRHRRQGRHRGTRPPPVHRRDAGMLRTCRAVRHLSGARKPRRHHRHLRADARPGAGRQRATGSASISTRATSAHKNPYADLERLAPYAIVVQIKTGNPRAQGMKPEEADFKRKFQMLRNVNYRGYVVLEYEAAEDAEDRGAALRPHHARSVRIIGFSFQRSRGAARTLSRKRQMIIWPGCANTRTDRRSRDR